MNILTEDGLTGLKNLLSTPESVEKLRNGSKIDCSIFEIEESKSLPKNHPTLLIPSSTSKRDRAADDAQNAILIHNHLKNISPRVACNPRLWVSLGFLYYQDYLFMRWPLDLEGEDGSARNKINDRYFLKLSGHMGYFRNAIARLWWTAHMTYNEKGTDIEDTYRLTRLAFERQDYQFAFLLRKYGSSREVCRSIFEHFLNNKLSYEERAEDAGKGYVEFIRLVGKRLNLYSSVYLLDLVGGKKIDTFISREADAFFVKAND